MALYEEGSLKANLDGGDGSCLSKLLYFMASVNAHILLGVTQGLNIFTGRNHQKEKCIGSTLGTYPDT